MKFHSLVKFALASITAVLVGSCGGGGASHDAFGSGDLTVFPIEGTFYAGTVGIIQISGGVPPYALNSSEPNVLAVPNSFSGHILEVVPNNPGTVDAGLPPDSVPIRTVTISVRDQRGVDFKTIEIHVAHNFLTGYNAFFSPTNCESGQVCAGGDTLVAFDTVTNGLRYGNRPFRIEIVRGPCQLNDPISGTVRLSNVITTASDHEGKVLAVISCPAGVASGIGVIRLVDIGTGASTEYAFTISSESPSSSTLTTLPTEVTFTGADSAHCGTGAADFLVFDGQPPYTATSLSSNVIVTSAESPTGVAPVISRTQPGRFTVTVTNPFQCVDTQIVVTDARGGRTTFHVTSEAGNGEPPPPPVTANPNTINLGCGQSGSVLLIGGSGTFSTASTDPNISSAVSGSTLTISRAGTLPAVPGTPSVASTVNITDGTSLTTVTVISPQTCP